MLPTGQIVTPTLTPGSRYQRLSTGIRTDGNADADSAMSTALSPDGTTLLVLTSGFNTGISRQANYPTPTQAMLNASNGLYPSAVDAIQFPAIDPLTGMLATPAQSAGLGNGGNQTEFVFVYDVSTGVALKRQMIELPDTYNGIAWDPAGNRFYVSGGIDDRIAIYKNAATGYVTDAPFIILGHNPGDSLPVPTAYKGGILSTTPIGKAALATVGSAKPSPYLGLLTSAAVAGFGLSRDGKTLVAANWFNASASIVDTTTRKVTKEIVFTPPGTTNPAFAIGEFPFWVSVKSDATSGSYQKAYVTSMRDDQVVVLSGLGVSKVIPVPSGPGKSVLDPAQRYLYVACGNDDSVAVIDTVSDTYVGRIKLGHPGDPYKGATPNSVAISADGRRLYVTLGGWNSVAVVDLNNGALIGRIPTGWLPTSVSVSNNGKHLFVTNEKSTAGPNPGNLYYAWNTMPGAATNSTHRDEYTWELEKSGLLSIPTPDYGTLSWLSNYVDLNNNFNYENREPAIMQFLQSKIKHVIYIVNENRTFDQVLGDLKNGSNGDPSLTFFNQKITPNLHALAAKYVTLDNFYDSSETSGVGWNWCTQGHTNDYVEKTQPVDYGNGAKGFTYDWQGIVSNINLGLPATGGSSIFNTRITGILDSTGSSTILPGTKDPSATEGADDLKPTTVGGYIWESVQRRYGLNSVRNYGWQIDLTYYGTTSPLNPVEVPNPYPKYPQSSPSTPSIQKVTDPYYRAFDQSYPDIFRIQEWKREFNAFEASNTLPALEVMTIPHDHTGSLGAAYSVQNGLTTPQLELADHDYAIGTLVEAVSHSKDWGSTAIIMIEDDPQDGQDHVEAHRSIIHIISPWTKSQAVVHTTYFTTSALRTVEDLLGVNHLGFNDANAQPIADAFTTHPTMTAYTPTIPGILCTQAAPSLVPACKTSAARTASVKPLHDGAWWAKATAGLDFSKPDHVNPQYYNAILEYGITGRGTLPKASAVAVASKNYDPNDADGDGK